MTAVLFSLTYRETGGLRGAGLLCVDARYASVYQRRDWMLERIFLTAEDWRDVAREVSVGLSSDPLPPTSRIAQILGGGKSVNVQWLHDVWVTVERPDLVAQALDRILRDSVRDGG